MNPQTKVSVIIASYNSGRMIHRTLQSLDRQTMTGFFEVIVVDSSSEGTAEGIAENYPNVRVFLFSQRKYPGDARNFGISKAKGNIVAFLDADCEAERDWIEKIIEAHRLPYPAIGGAIANGTGGGMSWAAYFCEFSQWMPGTAAQWMEDVAAANMSYKRDVFHKNGAFIEGTYCSDTEFHWRLAKNGIQIRFDPSVRVTHHSIDTFSRFLRHERFHGGCFAKIRSRAHEFSSVKRYIYALLSPFLPIRLFWKVCFLNVKNRVYWRYFLKYAPLLILGIASWSIGEAEGYIWSDPKKQATATPVS